MLSQSSLYALASVIIVSFLSLLGIFFISMHEKKLRGILLLLVSFSTGALLGDVFLHLLPESSKNGLSFSASIYILSGILVFFVLEKIIHWRHCHLPESKEHIHPFAMLNLFGDGVHNFLDGILIGASYLASLPLGIATTFAIIFHEIPQEIGDFGVLLHGGFTKKKALLFNFVSAVSAILGTIAVLILGKNVNIESFFVPFTAGAFIYIAGADLIPELHKELSLKKSFLQLTALLLGISIMTLLLLAG
ncbi:MAG: ZIP family metal transporter [Nanoarchaeota archaeon]